MTPLSMNPICDPAVLVQLETSLKKKTKIKGRRASIPCSRLAARSVLDHCFPH